MTIKELNTKYTDIDENLSNSHKDIKIEHGKQAIQNAIDNICGIDFYTVPGRPEFGSRVGDYLFEINDDITSHSLKMEIENRLNEFEPRVFIKDVQILSIVNGQELIAELTYGLVDLKYETFSFRFRIGY